MRSMERRSLSPTDSSAGAFDVFVSDRDLRRAFVLSDATMTADEMNLTRTMEMADQNLMTVVVCSWMNQSGLRMRLNVPSSVGGIFSVSRQIR